jgi:phosphoglucomutase
MSVDPRAGKPAELSMLVDVPRLMTAFYTRRPDPSKSGQSVAFGTSGHRGSAFDVAFNEDHILAITQAICEYRRQQAITGPLFLGADTHALSQSAWASALEVLAANGVNVMIDDRDGYTPIPRPLPTASSSRLRTTRPATVVSNTTHPTAVPPTPT